MFLLQNLEFYDQRGVKQASTFDISKGFHTFELVLDEVSVGLFSTQQIHIFERCINKVDNQQFLSNPRTTEDQQFKFKFKTEYYKNFFLYKIDFDTTSKSYYVSTVTKEPNKIDLKVEENSNGSQTVLNSFEFPLKATTEVESENLVTDDSKSFINDNDVRIILEYNNSVDTTTLNIGFLADREKEYTEVLELYLLEGDTETKVAEISLFSSAIAEDERLNTILTNFGQTLTIDDAIVFRDSDVQEDLPNHKILNNKKKEMILEFSNIIPYIGSYKGLINALKYYGYSDLRLKEWWLNFNFTDAKLFQEEIDTTTFKQSQTGKFNPNLKKTGKFSLVYDITKPTGEVDEFGIPETEEVFMFTPEEVLLKLFGLKQLLKNKFLPLGTRIVDITGEGVYFSRVSTQTWTGQLQTFEVNKLDYDVYISVNDTIIFIDNIDTSTYSNTFPYSKDVKLSDMANVSISNLATFHLDSFEAFGNLYDSPNRKGYAEVTLTNETFKMAWEDINSSWENLPNGNLSSWNTVSSYPFYEIEWEIYNNNPEVPFYLSKKGNIESLNTITFNTNATGYYDVVVKLKDLYTNTFVKRYENMFSVELPNPKFGVVYNSIEQIEDWNGTYDWDTTAEWGDRTIPQVTWDDAEVTWDSLDPINYMNKEVLTGSYVIDILELDKNNEVLYLDKTDIDSRVFEDIDKQKYITFINDKPLEFVEPQEIVDIDAENSYIFINTNKEIILNDLVEVYVSTEVEDYELSENVLTIQGVLRSSVLKGVKVYFGNDEDDITLTSLSVTIDELNQTTIIVLEDQDQKTFQKTFNKIEILSDFSTYEILEKEFIDGFWKVKVDWNRLVIQNKQSYDLGIPSKPLPISNPEDITISFDFYNLIDEAQRFDIDVITNLIIGKRRTLYPYVNFNDDLLSEKIRVALGEQILSVETKTRSVDTYIRTGYRPTELQIDITFETYNQLDSFITLKNNLQTETEKLKCWWGLCYGEHSIEVLEIDKDFSDTSILVKFKDVNRELFYITKNFKCKFTSFDIQTALKYGCRTDIKWEDCYNLEWRFSKHLNWDVTELTNSHLCGFKIFEVSNGDTIIFNDSKPLQFLNVSNLQDVADQLTNTNIEEFKRFDYIVYDDYVHAVAKSFSQECLGLLKFDGDLRITPRISTNLATSFPIPPVMQQEQNYAEGTKNNRMLWNRQIRDWSYYKDSYVIEPEKIDEDFSNISNIFETYQNMWTYTVNGNFRWNNIKVSENSVVVPKMTIVYFYGDISEIIGKSKYVWKIIDEFNTETLIETINDRISYMFDREGSYSVSLTVYDGFGNFAETSKKSFIIVKS